MPHSTSLLAYDDVRQLLDAALTAPKGIRVPFRTPEEAITIRHRAYAFRKMDRKLSLETYTPEDVRYGRSAYDVLVLTVDGVYLYMRRSQTDFKIEEL